MPAAAGFYADTMGRPGLPPGVYFRLLLIGLEALKGDRVGRHSLRVNQKYRITFLWGEGGHADEVI